MDSAATERDAVKVYLAERAGVQYEAIESYSFVASPSHAWSDVTFEDFSCSVKFTVNGEERADWWGETDVVKFLNRLGGAK